MRLFLVSSVILTTVKACWPIMINVPQPVVHNECIQSGCQNGYVCGRYGCARERKVFGVKSLKETAASNEDSITPMKHLTSTRNVAASMFQCCEDNLLPDGCLEKCSFAAYSKKTILEIFMKQTSCSMQALPVLHYCASRSRDHRTCCSRRGIPEACQIFCGPPFDQTTLNHQQLLCMEYLDTMKACFYEDFPREFVVRRRKLNAGKTFF